MRKVTLFGALVLAGLCFLNLGCSGGGGGGASGGSHPSSGVYRGTIRDDSGAPVTGAVVSIDGIEASTTTDSSGKFEIVDSELATATLQGAQASGLDVEISVLAPGFAPYVSTLAVEEGALVNVDLVSSGLVPQLDLKSPQDGKILVIPAGCDTPEAVVEGFAGLDTRESFRLDVALVVDRSGSAADPAFDVDNDGNVDSILEAEVAALRCFVEGLNDKTTRVSVFHFNDSAESLVGFTRDLESVSTGLSSAGPPGGGTNFEAAFAAVEQAFEDLAASDAAEETPSEEGAPPLPTPFRAVVFLSDGIATSHGVPRDTTDSNLTQSRADRAGAIAAAASLGESTGAQLFAYSILPENDTNKQRTTLPHCVAACGGGKYETVSDIAGLSDSLCGQPLLSLLTVTIENITLGAPPVTASLLPDGSFSQAIGVATGPAELVGAPGADGTVENLIRVTLTAFSGALEQTAVEEVALRLIEEDTYTSLSENEIFDAEAAPAPVSGTNQLRSPQGKPISANLRNLLVGNSKGLFEDAIELRGVETFTATDPVNPTVTVLVDFVHKGACYNSDVGYFEVDLANPPATVDQAMQGAVVLFNTGSYGLGNCSAQILGAGVAHFEVTVEAGKSLAFFLIPNRTLAQHNATPQSQRQVLLTMNRLNPGGFDQVMTFRSLNGRTEEGSSTNVETPGPMLIFAFEDLSVTQKSSDQDYEDVVFTVRSDGLTALEQTAGCD